MRTSSCRLLQSALTATRYNHQQRLPNFCFKPFRLLHYNRNNITTLLPRPLFPSSDYTRSTVPYVLNLVSSSSAIVKVESSGVVIWRKPFSTSPSPATSMPEFRIDDYDCVGFDLDHTLARYRLDNLYEHVYGTLCRYLVDVKGYDKRLLEPLSNDGYDFLIKGLLVDAVRGNLLKIGRNGTILRASHGTQQMSDDEIASVYGPAREWQPLDAYRHTLNDGIAIRGFKDYFDIPAALVSARIVDLIDASTHKLDHEEAERPDIPKLPTHHVDDVDTDLLPSGQYDFLKDVRQGLIHMFRSEAFALGTGGYFSAVRDDPAKFLWPCDDATKRWLRELKRAGKFTFLVTGSASDYAALLCEYCLGNDWLDYFDVIVSSARKPGFFSGHRPFVDASFGTGDADGKAMPVTLERGKIAANGNFKEMLALAERVLAKSDPRALYFGDNIIQDVFTPAKFSRCHSVAIVEEMEAEGMIPSGDTHPASRLLTSERWGSFFVDRPATIDTDAASGLQRVDTFWAGLLLTHSRLSVPSVSCVAGVPLNHALCSGFNAADPTSPSGFYPGDPVVLHPDK